MKNQKTKRFPSYKDIISLRLGKKKNVEEEPELNLVCTPQPEGNGNTIIVVTNPSKLKQQFINTSHSKWYY